MQRVSILFVTSMVACRLLQTPAAATDDFDGKWTGTINCAKLSFTKGPFKVPMEMKVEKGAGGKKIYRITDEIRIEGKIQKPEAFFFYQKSSINYDWQELKQDFIPKILDSVSHAPF